ncbi:Crp/Fnr family transcriptional regulator [Cesiribacter sp. SM1]|uniref:Crp/Fnr family transcriptional regulator n=1 Tax=Cesiribacter sp. SM1 TaxID=2861196 RepID=UPI001CD1B7D8|nr:Crp/Fnr family transcriptional regulator [Cesiribacter sp. SM1]
MNTQSIINNLSRYITLTAEEEALYLSKVRFRKFQKGQFIVQQGDICTHESYVIAGCLKTYHIDENGNERIVMFSVEDWWTSDLGSFLTQKPSAFNVQCLETCELAQLSYHDQNELYQLIPKLEHFSRIAIQKAYIAAYERLVYNFSLPAKERYLEFKKRYPNLDQRVPQYQIASYLGITPEFFSKIRSQLIHEQ